MVHQLCEHRDRPEDAPSYSYAESAGVLHRRDEKNANPGPGRQLSCIGCCTSGRQLSGITREAYDQWRSHFELQKKSDHRTAAPAPSPFPPS